MDWKIYKCICADEDAGWFFLNIFVRTYAVLWAYRRAKIENLLHQWLLYQAQSWPVFLHRAITRIRSVDHLTPNESIKRQIKSLEHFHWYSQPHIKLYFPSISWPVICIKRPTNARSGYTRNVSLDLPLTVLYIGNAKYKIITRLLRSNSQGTGQSLYPSVRGCQYIISRARH